MYSYFATSLAHTWTHLERPDVVPHCSNYLIPLISNLCVPIQLSPLTSHAHCFSSYNYVSMPNWREGIRLNSSPLRSLPHQSPLFLEVQALIRCTCNSCKINNSNFIETINMSNNKHCFFSQNFCMNAKTTWHFELTNTSRSVRVLHATIRSESCVGKALNIETMITVKGVYI